jgi:hypothetical protein
MCAIQSTLEPCSMLISCHMWTWISVQRWMSVQQNVVKCSWYWAKNLKGSIKKASSLKVGIGSSHVPLLPNSIPSDFQTTHPFLSALHHLIGCSSLLKGWPLFLSYGLELHMLAHCSNALLLAEYLYSKSNTVQDSSFGVWGRRENACVVDKSKYLIMNVLCSR